jgi:hypothetical protein
MLARTESAIVERQSRPLKPSFTQPLQNAFWIAAGVVAAAIMIVATVKYGIMGPEIGALG